MRWNARKKKIWNFAIVHMAVALKKGFAASVCNTICALSSCQLVVFPISLSVLMIAVLKTLLAPGNCLANKSRCTS